MTDPEEAPKTVDYQKEADEFFAVYSEYAKTLRTWFVAFGVGGPVLFLTQDKMAQRIQDSGNAQLIIILFSVGVGAQVFLALINKWANYFLYFRGDSRKGRKTKLYIRADWVSNQLWFDIILDAGTMVVFGLATWLVLSLFT